MKVEYSIALLHSEEDWYQLEHVLSGGNQNSNSAHVVQGVIRHLKNINVESYLIEEKYIDRDYSSDYRYFYAQTFRTYGRHCKRIHFFAANIETLEELEWSARFEALRENYKTSYCGFCVVRPLPESPIGRTVLQAKGVTGSGLESVVTCRAKIRAHLFGADLDVTGTSFMQQDARVGACAQISIWAGFRHLHQRHKYDWLSVADITKHAAPNSAEESMLLPAGSGFLTTERMIRAISEMGVQPLYFKVENLGADILPYVESGIPVILGLRPRAGALGHAVTIMGRVFAKQKNPTKETVDYVPAYIAHDDQAGPYMLVPMDGHAVEKFGLNDDQIISYQANGRLEHFNIDDHGAFAVALMPIKVFSTAKAAECTAWGRIHKALSDMPNMQTALIQENAEINERLIQELVDAFHSDAIVLRTYLTSASGYRRHIATGTACNYLKDVLLQLHLPHFTWITEISTIDSYNQASPGFRRIYGHSVLDATSTGSDKTGLLALHLPGMAFLYDVDASPDQREKTEIIPNDSLYQCREKRFDH